MDKYYMCSCKTINSVNKNENVDAIEEHESIIKYIKQKNKQKAVKELMIHIYNSEERVKKGYYH
jgi:DNA-binding GntR family transcriptional regulator